MDVDCDKRRQDSRSEVGSKIQKSGDVEANARTTDFLLDF